MKSILILIFISLLTSVNDTKDNFIGVWSMSMSTTEASNMEVCHRFTFSLSKEGKGNLRIELSLPNESNNQDLFLSLIPFDYKIVEENSNEYTREIEVQYLDKVEFNHIQNNRRNKHAISTVFMNYINELEQKLSGLEASYQLSLDGQNYLVIQGFSLVENSSFTNFKKGGRIELCNDLK